MRLTVFLAAMAFAVSLISISHGQTTSVAAQKPTFAQVAAAARITLRDSAELPMKIRLSMVVTDIDGRVRKKKTGSFHYDFHGYNPRAGKFSFDVKGSRGTIAEAVHTMFFSVVPSLINAPDAEKNISFEVMGTDASGALIAAKAAPLTACNEFAWDAQHQFPTYYCGMTEFQFDKNDLAMHSFAFNSGGLSVKTNVSPFGYTTMLGYSMETQFEKALLPGDPQPFLIPRQVIITIETEKGKVVIASEFALQK